MGEVSVRPYILHSFARSHTYVGLETNSPPAHTINHHLLRQPFHIDHPHRSFQPSSSYFQYHAIRVSSRHKSSLPAPLSAHQRQASQLDTHSPIHHHPHPQSRISHTVLRPSSQQQRKNKLLRLHITPPNFPCPFQIQSRDHLRYIEDEDMQTDTFKPISKHRHFASYRTLHSFIIVDTGSAIRK